MVSVKSRQHGLLIVEQLPALYEKYQLAIASGVVLITLDRPFQVLVTNLDKTPQRLTKHKVIGSVTTHPLSMLPIRVTSAEVLRITTHNVGTSTDVVSAKDQPAPNGPPEVPVVAPAEKGEQCKSGNSTQDPIDALEKFDLSHVPSSDRDR